MTSRRIAVLILAIAVAPVLMAQSLTVSLAPGSPDIVGAHTNRGFKATAALLRFEATGGTATVDGLILTAHADPSNNGFTGFQAWLDDGDGRLDRKKDLRLAQSRNYKLSQLLTFDTSMGVVSGTAAEVWIVMLFAPQTRGRYSVAVESPFDVITPDAFVSLGTPAPESTEIRVSGRNTNNDDDDDEQIEVDPYLVSSLLHPGPGCHAAPHRQSTISCLMMLLLAVSGAASRLRSRRPNQVRSLE